MNLTTMNDIVEEIGIRMALREMLSLVTVETCKSYISDYICMCCEGPVSCVDA
jgi:hypothetical protein